MPAKLPSLKNLSSRQRSFCKRFAAGEEGEVIIADLWPGRDASWMLCRLMANERVAAFLASAVAARSLYTLLITLDAILNDPKSNRTHVQAAGRLFSQLGYLDIRDLGALKKKCSKVPGPSSDEDEALAERLFILGKKATS